MTANFKVKNGLTVGTVDIINSAGEWIGPAIAGSTTISSSAPASAVAGDLWWDSTAGSLFIYYNNGTSSQWVAASTSGIAATGTPVDNQLAVWTSATAVEGSSALTFDGTTLTVLSSLDVQPPVGGSLSIGKNGASNHLGLTVWNFGTLQAYYGPYGVRLGSGNTISWSGTSTAGADVTAISQDSAGIVALKQGTTPGGLHIYNT